MAANEQVLGDLHTAVAKALTEAVNGQEVRYTDDDGQEIVNVLPPSAAILQAAAKFLKDNEITCAPSDDNAMGELKEAAARRAAKREEFKASKLDKATANDGMDFMKGLH